jgi:plastocyanin
MQWGAMYRVTVVLAVLTLVLVTQASGAPAARGAAEWQVLVGRATDDHAIQAQAYFPTVITVVVTWTLGGLYSHTVTFLSGQPRPANPVLTPDGLSLQNPLVAFAQGGSTYDGSHYANSGILGSRANTYSLTFSTPGVFPYLSLIQRGMEGTVVVLPAGSRPPKSMAEYRTLGEQEWAVIRARGEGLAQSAPTVAEPAPGNATNYYISSGFGGNEASVMRFLPQELTVKVGDTVTWVQSDPQEIHTVTFPTEDSPISLTVTETPPLGPPIILYDPLAIQPQGGPVHRGVGYYNSGIMQPFARYTLTFLQPGAYSYICIPHANLGQAGTIIVQ